MAELARTFRILSVEDNPADRRLIQEFLECRPVQCLLEFAEDGEGAMKALRERQFDLILLDLNIPRIDGREILRRLKESDSMKHVPVVVFTTSNSRDDILSSYRLYANAYFTKPSDLDAFAEVMSKIQSHWLAGATLPDLKP